MIHMPLPLENQLENKPHMGALNNIYNDSAPLYRTGIVCVVVSKMEPYESPASYQIGVLFLQPHVCVCTVYVYSHVYFIRCECDRYKPPLIIYT